MTKEDKAVSLFDSGYNCAQSVFAVFAAEFGLTEDLAFKTSCAFGGGMSHAGEVCGAATGALMALGLGYGSGTGDDTAARSAAKLKSYDKGKAFLDSFRKEYGSVLCRDILGVDFSGPDPWKEAREKGLFQTKCRDCVRGAVRIATGLL